MSSLIVVNKDILKPTNHDLIVASFEKMKPSSKIYQITAFIYKHQGKKASRHGLRGAHFRCEFQGSIQNCAERYTKISVTP